MSGRPVKFCAECQRKGHHCFAVDIEWAQDDEPKCAFCEDGEPCPISRRLSDSGYVEVRRAETAARTVTAAAVAIAEVPAKKVSGSVIDRITQYNGGVPPKEVPVKEKICGREGCGKELQERNTSGFCSKHFYDSKRKSAAPVKAKAAMVQRKAEAVKVHRGGQSNGHSKVDDMGVLQVSRDQLVSMFSAWSLQDQVGCVQLWLNKMSELT